MPILNYTTTISVSKTAGEIQEILAKAGANRVMIEFGADRTPDAIYFEIDVNNNTAQFRLPSRWHGVAQALQDSKVERKFKTEEQARRVAWRIIKDWCEAQLAIIEAGAAELPEVFFPYLINPRTNDTIFHDFVQFQLPPGDPNAKKDVFED